MYILAKSSPDCHVHCYKRQWKCITLRTAQDLKLQFRQICESRTLNRWPNRTHDVRNIRVGKIHIVSVITESQILHTAWSSVLDKVTMICKPGNTHCGLNTSTFIVVTWRSLYTISTPDRVMWTASRFAFICPQYPQPETVLQREMLLKVFYLDRVSVVWFS
jgi:hypothetical protein